MKRYLLVLVLLIGCEDVNTTPNQLKIKGQERKKVNISWQSEKAAVLKFLHKNPDWVITEYKPGETVVLEKRKK